MPSGRLLGNDTWLGDLGKSSRRSGVARPGAAKSRAAVGQIAVRGVGIVLAVVGLEGKEFRPCPP
jgi:hypothetical protein